MNTSDQREIDQGRALMHASSFYMSVAFGPLFTCIARFARA